MRLTTASFVYWTALLSPSLFYIFSRTYLYAFPLVCNIYYTMVSISIKTVVVMLVLHVAQMFMLCVFFYVRMPIILFIY
jgi:hypothetical protein